METIFVILMVAKSIFKRNSDVDKKAITSIFQKYASKKRYKKPNI